VQAGLAGKFFWDFAGEVPLILKLNGKTGIPAGTEALSPLHASVADAVRLGGGAVGYTLYVGAPARIDALLEKLHEVTGGPHRALVFSQFTGFLGKIRDRLEAEGNDGFNYE
jgi:class I fructose-bisphosphate aldolase